MVDTGRNLEYEEELYAYFEHKAVQAAIDYNKQTKFINLQLFTLEGVKQAFLGDIIGDLALVQTAINLVLVYTLFFLGSCSPIHCRSFTTFIGIACIGLSYFSGFGVMFLLGGEVAGVHNLLPFLLIGIGVDDMFVIANAID